MQEQMNCFYLDSSINPASDMLKKCVGNKNSPYSKNCGDNPMKQETQYDLKETARMNDIMINRGMIDYYVNNNYFDNSSTSPPSGNSSKIQGGIESVGGMEGFTVDNGPGKSNVLTDECPEGFTKKNDKCIQVCQNCVYRDNMKSREFNEADPCFPNGVYDGIDSSGGIKCTCGNNNQYCSDNFIKNLFTSDGMMLVGNSIIMNTGLTDSVNNLFDIGQF